MNIRPVGKKILVRIIKATAEAVVGGIIVNRAGLRGERREAIIQALPTAYAGELSVGMTVFMKPYAGTEVVLNGERLVFCREDELEAAIE